MINIVATDSRITKIGRFYTEPDGFLSSGWAASMFRFHIVGCTGITFNTAYKVRTLSGIARLTINVDDSLNKYKTMPVTQAGTIGYTSVTLGPADGLTTGSHDVWVKCTVLPGYKMDYSEIAAFVSMDINDGATVTAWPMVSGTTQIQLIGDSWMSNEAEWQRHLPANLWDWHSISSGGWTSNEGQNFYPYTINGNGRVVLATDDPVAAAAVISYGVNDYNQAMPAATFRANLISLISKVRALQAPNVPKIVLLVAPDCIPAGRAYSTYGTEMDAIAASDPTISVIRADSTLVNSLSWGSLPLGASVETFDANHLSESAGSRQAWAQMVSDNLATILGISPPVVVNPYDAIPYLYIGSGMQVGGYGQPSRAIVVPPQWAQAATRSTYHIKVAHQSFSRPTAVSVVSMPTELSTRSISVATSTRKAL